MELWKRKTCTLTPWEDLPALVVALAPLPEHDLGAVVDAAVCLVAMEGVEVEVDVVDHADAAEPVADVAALGPEHRLVLVLRVVGHQLHGVALPRGVLERLPGDLVHQREGRVPFLVPHPGAVPHVLDPVLVLVPRVGGRKARRPVAHRQAVVLAAGLAEDAHGVHAAVGPRRGVRLGSPRQDLPALVLALAPLPEHDAGAVVHAAVVLVAVEGVEVEAGVVHHADAAEALAHVLALRPQHRRVLLVRVERRELHLHMQHSHGMDGSIHQPTSHGSLTNAAHI